MSYSYSYEEYSICFNVHNMPGCCGAAILTDFKIIDRYYNLPISKKAFNKLDKDEFFKYVEERIKFVVGKRRVFVTAVSPKHVQNKDQAYYHSIGTREPVIDMYKLMVKLKWTRQKSWVNPDSKNTLVSFYKNY
jgi:hypothetical protein